jgi:glycosyltransferase involved in cell wall biosynthesis
MNRNITAFVLTLNEERRLPFIYENLKDFCEIIVFDGGSTDGTEAFCNKNNIKFVRRPDEGSHDLRVKGMAWVFQNITTDYVLHVISTHLYPKELLESFSKVANENKLSAVYCDVIVRRYGQVVHRPPFRRISSACIFYKKSIITFEKTKIHDELGIQFDQNTMIRLEGRDELALHLIRDEECLSFTNKTIKYAVVEAEQKFKSGQKVGFFGVFFRPLYRFLYSYFRLGSFLYGVPGLIYAILNLVYDFQVNIILWELCNNLTEKNIIKMNEVYRTKFIELNRK